jgi:hypothetical protein
MDKAMSFIRGGREEQVNQATMAAEIAAARIAYRQKEERKAEKAQVKEHDKIYRKQVKDERRRMSEEKNRQRSTERIVTGRQRNNSSNEKVEFVGKQYAEYRPAHNQSLPRYVPTAQTNTYASAGSRKSVSGSWKSSWLGFLAWFRTRVLRIKGKLGRKK